MIIKNPTPQQLQKWKDILKQYIQDNFALIETKYVNLSSKVVRILNYAKDFTPLMQKQLTFSLKNSASKYDTTIVLWNEKDIKALCKRLGDEFDVVKNPRLRIEALYHKQKDFPLSVLDESYSSVNPIIDINPNGFVNFFDTQTNTYFYGVANLEPEEFIKEGHIFVQIFNKILRTATSNLAHGAVVGLDNKGILLCARGQRGKSTLAVLSMMEGFEYVSDDYLTLEKIDDELYSHPIYSIITLSPRMYNELYDKLEGCRFVSNNARKDKYVINIAKYHPQFRTKYPIKVCVFPQIVSSPKPSMILCDADEKGRAIVQLIQSTVSQVQDINSHTTILKMLDMVKEFEFYKINLCSDIAQNTQCLRDFITAYKAQKSSVEINKWLIDITFDIANFIDSEFGIIYTMNKFATNVYENLINGVSKESIVEFLQDKIKTTHNFKWQVNKFCEILETLGLLRHIKQKGAKANINLDFVIENNYNMSFLKHDTQKTIELIREAKDELCVK